MKFITPFNLFEHKMRDIYKGDILLSPERKMQPFEIKPINKILISNEFKNNKFGIDYNNEISIQYNDNEKHKLFTEKRLYQRTPFESIIEFNAFISSVFNKIYPTFFFESVDKLDDIDIFDISLSQSFNKTYFLSIFNEGTMNYFYIPYTLTKKYNEVTNKFDFYIYIITINIGRDQTRIYQEFNFDYNYNLGEINFIDSEIIGVKPYISISDKNKIYNLYADEHITCNYFKSISKKDDKIEEKPKNNVKLPISSKSFAKLLKKR